MRSVRRRCRRRGLGTLCLSRMPERNAVTERTRHRHAEDSAARIFEEAKRRQEVVASIFELRSGLAMPETVVDLYTQATSAMLGLAGGGSAIEY